jgi:ribonuclease P protein component
VSEVIKNGRVYHTPLFSIRILKTETPYFKGSFVISKKECRLSVGRNMLKRKARSVFTQISTDLSPVYFVVFIKKALLEAGVDTIAEEYKKIFSK